MGSDERIPCDSNVFQNLRAQKEEQGRTWSAYLKWLFEQANRTQTDINDVSNEDIMNALDDVEDAAKEATSAAQSAERSVEELQR